MSKNGDHHYVPQFHLRMWENGDGKISQWGRIPFNNKLVCTPVTTAATAYVPGLYSLAHVKDEEAQQIETKLFGKIETAAKPALNKLINTGAAGLSVDERYWWTIYLNASLLRVPHIVEMVTSSVQERIAQDLSQPIPEFDAAKGDRPENTLYEWASKHALARVANSGLRVLVDLIQSEKAIDRIIHLRWLVKDVSTDRGACSLGTTLSNELATSTSHAPPSRYRCLRRTFSSPVMPRISSTTLPGCPLAMWSRRTTNHPSSTRRDLSMVPLSAILSNVTYLGTPGEHSVGFDIANIGNVIRQLSNG